MFTGDSEAVECGVPRGSTETFVMRNFNYTEF